MADDQAVWLSPGRRGLAAADGDYITGQQININGGVYM
jgi:hypothetical protein